MTSERSVSFTDIARSTAIVATMLARVLHGARHQLGDERLGLIGVGQNLRDDLADLGPLEVAERQPLHVREDGVAHVARDVLLERRAELPGEPDEDVLDRDDDHDDDDHRRQRPSRIVAVDEGADRQALSRSTQPAAFESGFGWLNKRVEERDEQRERKRAERRADHVGHDVARHAPPVRPQEHEQPAILGESFAGGSGVGARGDAHRRGVSRATGRMHSSGVTPPWRNEPRYRL